ncbi:MAG: OmpA family protein [Ghiorsea sp.]|nr:OmpA family protein [Ghiorsea sp.]
MFIIQRALTLICLLCVSSPLWATTLDELNQQVESFANSEQARFAPAAMKKITAYQGAAMLAAEEGSAFQNNNKPSTTLNHAIQQTLKTLDEARNTAQFFNSTYSNLLQLEKEADKAYVYHHKPRMLAEPEVETYYQQAKSALQVAIKATEKGKLNQASQAAKEADIAFQKTIDAAMPGLVEQSNRALDQADSMGAKRYAPRTWYDAEQALKTLELYAEDVQRPQAEKQGVPRPERVGYALELAVYAQKLAIHAKALSRDKGSYEKLMLQAKQERLEYAKALNIKLNYNEVGIDVNPSTLLEAMQNFAQEPDQHIQQIQALKATFAKELQEKLQIQHEEDQKDFKQKLLSMKSAFSSRLEQETFENKRQKKLRSLFKKGEVDVITNIDGSLIIRAKKIKFEPNSSKVDGKYFDFLARIKDALMLYPNRKVSIEGHTDSSGDAKTNRKLSLQRAEAVRKFLTAAGMSASRIRALGFGEAKPVASNMYKKGRAMNRRIDIVIGAPRG